MESEHTHARPQTTNKQRYFQRSTDLFTYRMGRRQGTVKIVVFKIIADAATKCSAARRNRTFLAVPCRRQQAG